MIIGIVGLVVVLAAVVIAVARYQGWRWKWLDLAWDWWERFMGSGPMARGERRAWKWPWQWDMWRRSGGAGASDFHVLPGEERGTPINREFDLGDADALGKIAGEPDEAPASAVVAPAPAAGTPSPAAPAPSGVAPASAPTPEADAPAGTSVPASAPAATAARTTTPARPDAPKSPEEPGLVIVLTVMAEEGRVLGGQQIREALTDLGFSPDENGVFHHYGSRRTRDRRPVFSVVNVLQPGMFDLDRMHELSTRGLSVFMQRPGPLTSVMAFDLMLDTGKRLARALDAVLCNDQRRPLNPPDIQTERVRIARFAHHHERGRGANGK